VSEKINLKRPGVELGGRREYEADFEVPDFEVPDFDLYGRRHEVLGVSSTVGVTRLSDGLHLDVNVEVQIGTTCDRTLEPLELNLQLEESEFLSGANALDLCIEDWEFDVARYTREALPSEVPMKTCAPGTEPVTPQREQDEVDPRWRGLDDLFASGF
jgi:uncharacterized metal-binding protein YceD (DUF177 family)